MLKLNFFTNLLFIILINFAFVTSFDVQYENKIKEIQYFIYYIPEKDIILCSDKIFSEKDINLIPNELKIDDKFTCVIETPNDSIYTRLNLHIPKINQKINYKNNLIDIFLGETLIFNNLQILNNPEKNNKLFLKKQILLKFSNSKVYLSKNKNCKNEFLNDCKFYETQDSIFKQKYLMLNFKLKENNFKGISFLERKSIYKNKKLINLVNQSNDNECNPNCDNGMCIDGECYCLSGYIGSSCSISKI